MPAGCVLRFAHFALWDCQDIEPDTSELLLSWCPLSFALSQSQSLQRRSCPEAEPCWVWLGQDPIRPRGEGHPLPWLLLAMISEPILKRPLTWFEQTVPLESCLWFGFCSLEWEEQGQATHRQERAQAMAEWGRKKPHWADSHAPGADGTLFYVWPQWIMSAKRLEAYIMERSHKKHCQPKFKDSLTKVISMTANA